MSLSSGFSVRIELGNDAMRYPDDIAAALRDLVVERLEGEIAFPAGIIRDSNGNTVGLYGPDPGTRDRLLEALGFRQETLRGDAPGAPPVPTGEPRPEAWRRFVGSWEPVR